MSSAGTVLDSILWFAGAALALLGAGLVTWALWWDRARGRRRCPQCWYDMGGVPGLRCPECGRAVAAEKRFTRTRRRWAWAAIGALVLTSGVVSMQVPAYRQGGWVGLVPSSVLVWWAPAEISVQPALRAATGALTILTPPGFNQRPRVVTGMPPWNAGVGMTTGEKLTAEAWSRLEDDRLWGWQARIFVNRYLQKAGDEMPWGIRFLDRWPAGEPVRAAVQPLHTAIASRARLQLWIGEVPAGQREPICEWYGEERYRLAGDVRLGSPNTVHLQARIGRTVVFSRSWPLPCKIVESRSDMVTRVADATFGAVVRDTLDPSLAEQDRQLVLVVNDRGSHDPWPDLDAAIVFEGEVLIDGEPVARSQPLWVERMRPVWKNWLEGPMEWLPAGQERLAAARERAQIRIRASPDGAAALYLAAPFTQPNSRCWAGEFTVPARWGPIERPRPAGTQ